MHAEVGDVALPAHYPRGGVRWPVDSVNRAPCPRTDPSPSQNFSSKLRSKGVGYEVVLFIPCEQALPRTKDNSGRSMDGIHTLGLLHTTVDLGSQAPGPGTYWVMLLTDESSIGHVTIVPVEAPYQSRLVAGFAATRASQPGPRELKLGEDYGSTTRELKLRASIPGAGGTWWSIDWSFWPQCKLVEGDWRAEPWGETTTQFSER